MYILTASINARLIVNGCFYKPPHMTYAFFRDPDGILGCVKTVHPVSWRICLKRKLFYCMAFQRTNGLGDRFPDEILPLGLGNRDITGIQILHRRRRSSLGNSAFNHLTTSPSLKT